MQPLADAAMSRSEADWLVGINGTRAMTAFNSKLGGFFKTTVGRVQTPTLAILVEREKKIRKFVPRDYWEIHRHVRCAGRAIIRAAGLTRNLPGPTTTTAQGGTRLGSGESGGDQGQMPGQTGHRHRGKQAEHIALAVAL